jgi:hypothetical protein
MGRLHEALIELSDFQHLDLRVGTIIDLGLSVVISWQPASTSANGRSVVARQCRRAARGDISSCRRGRTASAGRAQFDAHGVCQLP